MTISVEVLDIQGDQETSLGTWRDFPLDPRHRSGGLADSIFSLFEQDKEEARLLPIVKRIEDGRRVILIEEKLAAWRAPRGFVGNVGAAIALAATTPRAAGRIYNVGEAESLSELEWARRVAAVAGWTGEFVVLPADRMPPHLLMPGNA